MVSIAYSPSVCGYNGNNDKYSSSCTVKAWSSEGDDHLCVGTGANRKVIKNKKEFEHTISYNFDFLSFRSGSDSALFFYFHFFTNSPLCLFYSLPGNKWTIAGWAEGKENRNWLLNNLHQQDCAPLWLGSSSTELMQKDSSVESAQKRTTSNMNNTKPI